VRVYRLFFSTFDTNTEARRDLFAVSNHLVAIWHAMFTTGITPAC